ncbi:homeobox-leucine zipper protein ROC8-like [Magnolia sinica]|uniref:homeobox-leucine zipper protein ROC8-like n=1 Tax=Magnolia sinica TaxID=86752 RepID=UPI0026581EA5|nr:homeobox-leucine zipper protein ROC8-like [Magnolia sinica]
MYSNGLFGLEGRGDESGKKSLLSITSSMEGGTSGGPRGGGSGDDLDGSDRKKKRYHRHTVRQIQELESMFKECPHPDEKQRMQLSRDLGLEPRQIKFWFQNRRTQMKAQHERADNCALRAENDKIRCENIAIREALKNVICPSCGGPPIGEDPYFDEQKLRMENARLKEELDRVSSIASKYIGRPISQLPPIQPIAASLLDLTVGSYGVPGIGPSLDLDLLPGSSSSVAPLPMQVPGITEMEKSLMVEIATSSMEELIRLLQTNEPLWMKLTDGREVLDRNSYERIFLRSNHLKNPDIRIEASKDAGLVIMNALALVDMFMDSSKWMELFPTIISNARTIEILASGMAGNRSGSLQLMYEELQVLSPLVPTREFYFLRYCQQIEQGSWAIADVSFDISRVNQFIPQSRSRRLPSGCLIQDMPNGYSKVTWVEHVEIEEKTATHRIYRELINSGMAFGAQRWLTTLQRVCERFACLMVPSTSIQDLGVIPSPDGKRSMMKLAQKMINNFCSSISASSSQRWTTLSGLNDIGVRVSVHKSTDPSQPNGVILSAATSLWLPVSSQDVFNFFRDERTRAQWDVLSNGNSVQEVAHIANGSNPGNCISVLRALNASQNNMLILQESCNDLSGSLVVYAPVDLPSINIAMSGEGLAYTPLLPSGFVISPDGRPNNTGPASTSSNLQGSMAQSPGSLITVAFQILVSSLPSAKLNLESVTTVNNLISTTVQQIKAALNCSGA